MKIQTVQNFFTHALSGYKIFFYISRRIKMSFDAWVKKALFLRSWDEN